MKGGVLIEEKKITGWYCIFMSVCDAHYSFKGAWS